MYLAVMIHEMPRKKTLPNKILPLPNPDKLFHESWTPGRNPLNITHPFRCVALGPPNVGKTTICKNILLRADPPFKRVFVIHCDPSFSAEYDDVNGEMLDSIPAPEDWDGTEKTLVVLDDLEYKTMKKDQRYNLDRLFGFVSTHKNISCILCSQDAFNVPQIVRRCANLWILWKSPDMDSMATIARKSGIKSAELISIFQHLMPGPKDSLWLDRTDKSPYPIRKNGFTIIRPKKKDE
jgi:hypothetical protein